jgi:hypothetical protein
MPKYTYEVQGTAADGQTWTTSGTVEMRREGDFALVPDIAMRLSFAQLTKGQAVYGLPGVGCKGPYVLLRLLVERAGEGLAGREG